MFRTRPSPHHDLRLPVEDADGLGQRWALSHWSIPLNSGANVRDGCPFPTTIGSRLVASFSALSTFS